MKRLTIVLTIFLASVTLTACNQNESTQTSAQSATPAPMAQSSAAPASQSGTSGTVVETMNAAGYTYVQVDSGTEKIWAAAPEFSVNVGDQVVVPEGMAMHNYHSQTLDRDFPVVYFVDSVLNASSPMPGAVDPANTQMPEGHPPISGTPSAPEMGIELSGITKAEGGMTVGEIYSGKADLSGKTVALRGKVAKYSPQIMGTNWIHLQDGTGDQAAGTHDLTLTSNVQVKVGDTIVASGPLTLDKDFGYGYQYNLIMENAQVTVE